ncbi:MAG: Acylphosphatase [Pseudomonadales bacterium]|nr:Acylphosphatase [Pseudomonadales bacterium]
MCVMILVAGSVQGVGYRAFARSAARELGILGHARNLPDGRVEVLACGTVPALQEFTALLRTGPRWSRVEHLSVDAVTCRAPADFHTA